MSRLSRHGLDPLEVGVRAKAVVEARTGKAVAVCNFNGVDTSVVERSRNGAGLVDGVLVTNGMATVAQRDIRDVEFLGQRISPQRPEASVSVVSRRAARRSAVASAALVMMSRLPA